MQTLFGGKHVEDVKVMVVKFPDRKNLMLRYIDPLTNKPHHKTSGTSKHGEAVKAAGKWESELREGRYAAPVKMTWAEFRRRYETEVLASLATTTDEKAATVFDAVEAIINPARLRDLSDARLSHFQAQLRSRGNAESTVKGYLAHLKAALRWAERIGLIPKAPKIVMPKRAKGSKGTDPMKGRPITTEEFERMLAKVEAGLQAASPIGTAKGKKRTRSEAAVNKMKERHAKEAATAAPSWKHYIEGLWLSGLRLTESLSLTWDDDAALRVDLSGKYPMLAIPAALEKGNKDRVLPISPEFAEFLMRTPEADRTGFVFNPRPMRERADTGRLGNFRVSKIVAAIGEAAGVKVNTDAAGKVKFASAHDLRRSFGERWASRVMPTDLRILMRHESIETTLRFYVGRNAQNTAKTLWEAHDRVLGNTLGNSRPESTATADAHSSQPKPR